MAARSSTSEFQPAPPKTRIPSFGKILNASSHANVRVIQPATGLNRGLNMSTAPTTNGDRVAGVASSKSLSVKGTTARL